MEWRLACALSVKSLCDATQRRRKIQSAKLASRSGDRLKGHNLLVEQHFELLAADGLLLEVEREKVGRQGRRHRLVLGVVLREANKGSGSATSTLKVTRTRAH